MRVCVWGVWCVVCVVVCACVSAATLAQTILSVSLIHRMMSSSQAKSDESSAGVSAPSSETQTVYPTWKRLVNLDGSAFWLCNDRYVFNENDPNWQRCVAVGDRSMGLFLREKLDAQGAASGLSGGPGGSARSSSGLQPKQSAGSS